MTNAQSCGIAWPDRRSDIADALAALVILRPGAPESMPDLTNAIHWLIDDTGWDDRPPADHIGLLLRDQAEADAIKTMTEPLVDILDELGPRLSDTSYLEHPKWVLVRERARAALVLLESNP